LIPGLTTLLLLAPTVTGAASPSFSVTVAVFSVDQLRMDVCPGWMALGLAVKLPMTGSPWGGRASTSPTAIL
jgi:hypothetical protein